MDRHQKFAHAAVLSPLVRQFAPSRIERQLLARALECVVAARHEDVAARGPCGSEEGRQVLGGLPVDAGRRNAA